MLVRASAVQNKSEASLSLSQKKKKKKKKNSSLRLSFDRPPSRQRRRNTPRPTQRGQNTETRPLCPPSLSSTMPASVSDDPIGTRAALRDLLELRAALVDDGRRAGEEPAGASGEGGRSSCCREWEEALVTEVQVCRSGSQKGRARLKREEKGSIDRSVAVKFFLFRFFQKQKQKNSTRHRTSSAAPARPSRAQNTPRPSAPWPFSPAGTSWICLWRARRTLSKKARRRRRAAAAQTRRRLLRPSSARCARGPPRCSTRGGPCWRTARPSPRESLPRSKSARRSRRLAPRRRRRSCES